MHYIGNADGGFIMDLQQIQNKKRNYMTICFTIGAAPSFISVSEIVIIRLLITAIICCVIFNFLKKRKQDKLGICNNFVMECFITVSFALIQILGYLTNIFNIHTFNFFQLGIIVFYVIAEGIILFRE